MLDLVVPVTFLFSLSPLKREWVLGDVHSSFLSCCFPRAGSPHLLPEPCLVLSALLGSDIPAAHTEHRNVQVKGSAIENGAWEVCGASPALTSSGWRQAQHMLSTNHSEALCRFFSSLSVFYWDAVKFLSPWVLFPCAALQLSNCSNTRVQFNSSSSRAWVLGWFVEDKWKEQLQMGFCAARVLNSLPSWLCIRSYLSEGWVGYEP